MDDLKNTNKPSEIALYDRSLLLHLDFRKSPAVFKPFISAADPGEKWLLVRPLQDGDYERGFLQLLSQLTSVGDINKSKFLNKFAQMRANGDYYVTVIEDTRINRIIGAASLIIEHKFIHDCGIRGRLEDVVVNDTYRGKQLGKLIVVTVTLLAQHLGCYKMTLDCKDKLIPFYNSLGYACEPGNSNSMTIRYDDTGKVQLNRTTSSEQIS
ncbi:probable glucosamine 6-phosphate N-acetyltransferase isoform X2 [Condylostylus longicornis]|uniref:probable glucosamine 6-phosphate N-acetyltransferase isoform X2 n=1 Tax=Condylostylus longicornis TaxID=2530218 RepID=UPI00244DFC0D|nr:probable glucosamine 6-phosphate N-acetyltransferase isoform X2 [Condylostylus longicornis]